MLPGAAKQLWGKFAGQSSLIIQGGMFTADDRVRELIATPEDAARLGADALAVAIGVRGPYEVVTFAGSPTVWRRRRRLRCR